MSALDDFARKPTRFKVTVFAVIGVVLGLLYYQFLFKKHRAARDEARADNQSLVGQNQKLDGDAKAYQKLLARSDELNRQIEENQKALPTESELPAFFDTLGRKVGEAGLEVKRWDYLKETPIESFVKVPIEIEITGTYYQIKRFFASLVQVTVPPNAAEGSPPIERERIVTVENLALFEPRVRNRELVMTAKFVAATFRQDAAATPKPAAKPAAKPAPAPAPAPAPGAGSGSAALPPAASPAGAKARTEDAMKTSEQRAGSPTPDQPAKLKEGTP